MLFSILKTVRRRLGLALVLIGAVALPSQASAATVLFTLTGGATASFSLDQSPTPTFYSSNFFALQNISGTFQGAPGTLDLNLDNADTFQLTSGSTNVNGLSISPFFTGSLSNPTFISGTYNFDGSVFNSHTGISTLGHLQLSIADVSAVPEPSTWMLMLVGFGAVGGSMRLARNRKKLDLQSA